MLGQLLANSFKSKYFTVNSVTLQALLPQVLRLQRLFQTVLRLWFNFHVRYLVASLGKPCIQKPLFKTSELFRLHILLNCLAVAIWWDKKQSNLYLSPGLKSYSLNIKCLVKRLKTVFNATASPNFTNIQNNQPYLQVH